MQRLFDELLPRLAAGETLDNPKFTALADRAFDGSRAAGAYTSRDAYDTLEAAVNQYLLLSVVPLVTTLNMAEVFEQLRTMMRKLPTQTHRTKEQLDFQQFSTPPTIALLAARLCDIHKGDILLEPSAGTGSLAVWARGAGAEVMCIEIAPRRQTLLRKLGFVTHGFDAELLDDVLPENISPHVILMNPPFSATGGRVLENHTKFGLRHIESALARLLPGGRLVAILGESVSFHRPGAIAWWDKLMQAYTIRANVGLAKGEYRKYGTDISVQLIVVDKIGAMSGRDWTTRLRGIVWGDGHSVEEAWEKLQAVPKRDCGASAIPNESRKPTLFVPYVPATLADGPAHPGPIVESATMAAAKPPDITYRPCLPPAILTESRLSNIQWERVIYTGQRHLQRLPDGARAGFFVGDGTGVGKGRALAAIIGDNWFQGRRRAVWFSVNKTLLEATRRDLHDLGLSIPLAIVNDEAADKPIRLQRGVLFSSYGSLIASSKDGAKRIDQILKWLGPDGVVILDEAHKAKNAVPAGQGEPTLTGQAVIDLQNPSKHPDLRVVYSSATGATNVRNMAYMTRLGLWGPGTAFPNGFAEFLKAIDSGGVGAMEMVSRDMKSLGMYLSGTISFGECPISRKAVEYREKVHHLTPDQLRIYNVASQAWKIVLQKFHEALDITLSDARARGRALKKFWGDHQRFFRQIICSLKVPTVIEEIEDALRADKSAVVSLVGTGESRTKEQVAKLIAEGGALEDLDFSPREILGNLIEKGFPTVQYTEQQQPGSDKPILVIAKDKDGNEIHSKRALRMKQKLVDSLSALHLPENPIDQLVNYFGEAAISEITGRQRRLIRDPKTGIVEYKKRAPDGIAMQRVNVYNEQRFQNGDTRIAIISDAGSVGISLHASNRARNQQRRVHIALELGWRADQQLQCFGRTHRSDQAVPPEYVLVSTELAGEKRFSSTIARRLGSLGALTKGDRTAVDNADWARYNFETQEGRSALGLMYTRILQGTSVAGLKNPRQILRDIGLLVIKDGQEDIRKEDYHNVPRFLNRILALCVQEQNALFNNFAELFDQTVAFAKANGTFDEGVTDIEALSIRMAEPPRVVYTDGVTGAETMLYPLEVERWSARMPFEQAERVRQDNNGTFLRHSSGSFVLVLQSGSHTNPGTGQTYRTFSVWKPEGPRMDYLSEMELNKSYVPVRPEEVRAWWTDAFEKIPLVEIHKVNILGGAILPLWDRLKADSDSKLRVVRVSTNDGQRIVGVEIPKRRLASVLRAIGLGTVITDPAEAFESILDAGETIPLVHKMRLKLVTFADSPAIELECKEPNRYGELRKLGLLNEQVDWVQRFFIPTDPEKGIPLMKALLQRYPVLVETEQVQPEVLPVRQSPSINKKVALADLIQPPVEDDEFRDLPVLAAVSGEYEGAATNADAMSPAAELDETEGTEFGPLAPVVIGEQQLLFE
jgi:hypothetical protein